MSEQIYLETICNRLTELGLTIGAGDANTEKRRGCVRNMPTELPSEALNAIVECIVLTANNQQKTKVTNLVLVHEGNNWFFIFSI